MRFDISKLVLPCVLALAIGGLEVKANPILWIDDKNGEIGKVDLATGNVTLVGNAGVILTDIAFDPTGNLYGIAFTGTSTTGLYSINTTNGAATLIGNSNNILNALTFGQDGTLYSAGPNGTDIYSLNTSTGAATILGNTGFNSAGDLAFHDGQLYMAATNPVNSTLVSINTNTYAGTSIGSIGFGNVYGLANGDNNVLYGVAGTKIMSIDTISGVGTSLLDYSAAGKALFEANGTAFFAEASPVPEPSSLALAGLGGIGLIVGAIRRRRAAAV